jgi:polyhydroxyalkanoate synthesis regulator phasin
MTSGGTDSVNEGLQRYLNLASGLTRTTLSTTERVLAGFVRQGEVAAEHAERVVEEIIARSVDGSGALARLVRAEVEQAVEQAVEHAGYVRAEEVRQLRAEVESLRAQLAALDGHTPGDGPANS